MKTYLFILWAMFGCLSVFAQVPANDEPCGATTLTVAESSDNCIPSAANINVANITYANLVRPTSCNPATNTNPDMWFKFTTPNNANGYKTSVYFYSPYWLASNAPYIEIYYYVTACNGTYYLSDCWSIDATYAQGATPRVINTQPNQEYYIRYTRGAIDNSNPNIKLCLTTGKPPLNAKIGINTKTPAVNFDVAGTVQLRDDVGIGTSTPSTKLHVIGSGTFSDNLNVGGGANSYAGANISKTSVNIYADQTTSGDKFVIDRRYNGLKYGMGFNDATGIYGSGVLFYAPLTEDYFAWGRGDPFYAGGTYFAEWMRLKNNGNLGIGTNNPDAKLHIVGSIKMVDTNQGAGKVLTSDANGVGSWQTPPTAPTQYWSASGSNISNTNAGNIGIGTSTPTSKLNVNGQVTIDQKNFGGYGGLLIKGNQVGSNYPNIVFTTRNGAGNDINTAYIGGDIESHTTGSESMGITFATNSNGSGLLDRLRIKANGNVGIGVTNPTNPLSFPASLTKKISFYPGTTGDVGISVSGNDLRIYCDNSSARVSFGFDDFTNGFTSRAYVQASGTTAMFVQGNLNVNGTTYTSDIRFKTQIQTLAGALPKVLQLRGTQYFFNTKDFPKRNFSAEKQIGLIAQEVEKIYPEIVNTDTDGYKSVNYTALVPVLIEALKEQQKQIEELKRLVLEKISEKATSASTKN